MDRLHIAFFGLTNSGKSTLVNALAGQQVSLVSPLPGTTTDPVRKVIELPGLGPCVLIDTAGLGDESALGAERELLTRSILDETDIAVILETPEVETSEVSLTSKNKGRWEQNMGVNAPNVPDIGTLATAAGIPVIRYTRGESVESLLERLIAAAPKEEAKFLTGSLVAKGDIVVLVMPQDSEAPKGRLILPQVQVIRELLDRGCTPVCCTPDSLESTISGLKDAPALVITDSQAFKFVNETIPADWPLTSFSILLAGAKGDIKTFVEGARAINNLKPGAKVLIAEACTHVPNTEDIGRVKIPAWLRKRVPDLEAVVSAGNDFPEDLSQYSLIIHCGACVANAALVRSRIRKALLAGVPITNYGIAIAALQGILDRVSLP